MSNEAYLNNQIITYIGNKRKILPYIRRSLDLLKLKNYSFLDLFSGSGIVARLAKANGAKKILANDIETYSTIINKCFLRNDGKNGLIDFNEQKDIAMSFLYEGFITKLYAPKDDNDIKKGERCFYTHHNAMVIDSIMKQAFEFADENTKTLLLASLIYEASVHTNTAGIFKGFYKNRQGVGQFGGEGKNALKRITGDIELKFPVWCDNETENIITQQDASELIEQTNEEYDVAYIDPPYNQHPYGSNYFMLNLIAEGKEPVEISSGSGIPTDWNRSVYNKREEGIFTLLKNIDDVKAKYVIVSYSAEAFLPIQELQTELSRTGVITNLQEVKYPVFRGSRNLRNRDTSVNEYVITIRK